MGIVDCYWEKARDFLSYRDTGDLNPRRRRTDSEEEWPGIAAESAAATVGMRIGMPEREPVESPKARHPYPND